MKRLIFIFIIFFTSINADTFSQGSIGVGIIAGGGSLNTNSGTKNYNVIGVNADYFIADSLSVGLGYTGWFGNSPSISQFTVPISYYIPLNEKFTPYIGAFYRYTYMGRPYNDYSSYGVKAGVAMKISRRAYLGAGWTEEYYGDCSNFKECSTGYPELLVIFTF